MQLRASYRLVFWAAVGLSLLWASVCVAQDEPIKKGYIMPPVVVTPGRAVEPELKASRAIGTVDGVKRLEMQARSLPEALSESSGVHIQTTNRGAGSPIIRGLVGPQNLILVDGVRFNTSVFRTGPNQYLALLDPYLMDRIEVVRGPSSVLYGNGAMGGVLQVLAAEAEPVGGGFVWDGKAVGRFASADLSGGGTLALSGSMGDFGFWLGGSYEHFGTLRVGGGQEVPLSAYNAGYWQAKMRYAPADWSLGLSYMGMLMRDAGRTDALGRGEVRQYDNDDHLAYLRFGWEPKGVLDELRLTAAFHRTREVVDRFNCQTDGNGLVADRARCQSLEPAVITKQRQNNDVVNVVGGEAFARLLFWKDRIRLTTGLDVYGDFVSSSRDDKPGERGNFSDGSTYLELGVFTHLKVTVYDDPGKVALSLTGGARYSHFSAFAPNVPGLGDVDYAHNGVVGSAGLQAVFLERLNMYFEFAQGFRAPNLQETTVLGNTGKAFEIPNADLKPERSNTGEVGIKVDYAPLDLRAAYYISYLTNPFDLEGATFEGNSEVDGTPVRRRINASGGRIAGFEGELGLTFWRLRLAGTFTWTDTEINNDSAAPGQPKTHTARRTPPVQGATSLRYEHPDRTAYAAVVVRWATRQNDLHPDDRTDLRICETHDYSGTLRTECNGTPGYVVLGLRGGWQFHENVRADLSVDNVLDTNYRVHGSGVDGAGVDARITLTARF